MTQYFYVFLNILCIFKYADDCYLAVPASSITTTEIELEHISVWAQSCNLKLNSSKSCEIIFTRPRGSIGMVPPPSSKRYRKSANPKYSGCGAYSKIRVLQSH